MSTQSATTTPAGVAGHPTVATRAGRARVTIVAAALAAGSAASAMTLLWRPGPDRGDLSYASLAPVRDAAWAAAVIDGLGLSVAAIAVSVAVCLLAPARGAGWATTGAVLTAVGGPLFASGVIAYAVLGWYATAGDAVAAESGAALLEYLAADPAHLAGFQFPGLVLFSVGSLLLATALWRACSVPRWLPIAWITLTVGQFAAPPNRILDLVQAAGLGTLMVIAWFLWRATARAR